jgi:L-aminopeptidase/D-esterase-like protein
MALGCDDVRVGCWTAPSGISGCTVVLPPPGTVGAVAVRGASPGTREAIALGPAGKVTVCHGVVLAGGSAYGLAAADGAMRWLEEQGVGYEVPIGLVPIVGAAIVLDGAVGDPDSRPGASAGRSACEAATATDPEEGSVGVGAGCTVAKVAGIEHAWRGGQGIAVRRAGGVTVGALVANNGVGEVMADDGTWIARSRAPAGAPRYPVDDLRMATGDDAEPPGGGGPTENTVIGCVVTDARLTKREAHRVADLAHGGIVRAVRPAHTQMDGDAIFCLATGRQEANLDLVAELAVDAVADAIRRGVTAAASGATIPSVSDG